MPHPRNRIKNLFGQGIKAGRETSLIEIAGLAERVKKFADLQRGRGNVFYTRAPDLESDHLPLKLTAKIFVKYDVEHKTVSIVWRGSEAQVGTFFTVNDADQLTCFDELLDQAAILRGEPVDGRFAYTVRQPIPGNFDQYITGEVEKIMQQLERCGVPSPNTSARTGGPNFNDGR